MDGKKSSSEQQDLVNSKGEATDPSIAEQLNGSNQDTAGLKEAHGPPVKALPYSTAHRILVSVALCLGNFGAGLVIGVLGPTLLDLQTISSSSISQAALLFTWSGCGRIVGSLLAFFTVSRFSNVLLVSLILLLTCLTQLTLPWCTHYVAMATVTAVVGLCMGFYGGVVTPSWFYLWRHKAPPFVQASGFIISCGCTVAPLLAKPFLMHRKTNGNVSLETSANISCIDSMCDHFVTPVHDASYQIWQNETATSQYNDSNDLQRTKVAYAYIIIASFLAVISLFFILLFIKENCKLHLTTENTSSRTTSSQVSWLILAVFSISQFLACGLEVTYGGLLTAFVVDHLGWDTQQGALVTFVFWLTLAAGRGLAIFIVKLTGTSRLVLFNSILSVGALLLLTFGWHAHKIVTWISSCLVGFSLSSNVANVVNLAFENYGISGRATSAIMGVGYTGILVVPGVAGVLIQYVHQLCYVYTLLAMSIMFLLLYPAISRKQKSTLKSLKSVIS